MIYDWSDKSKLLYCAEIVDADGSSHDDVVRVDTETGEMTKLQPGWRELTCVTEIPKQTLLVPAPVAVRFIKPMEIVEEQVNLDCDVITKLTALPMTDRRPIHPSARVVYITAPKNAVSADKLWKRSEPDALDLQCDKVFETLRSLSLSTVEQLGLLEQCCDYLKMEIANS